MKWRAFRILAGHTGHGKNNSLGEHCMKSISFPAFFSLVLIILITAVVFIGYAGTPRSADGIGSGYKSHISAMNDYTIKAVQVFSSGNSPVSAGNDTISIGPVNNLTAGEIFSLNGTTTLPAGKTLVIDIEPVRLHPAPSREPPQNTTAFTRQTITEKSANGITRWSFVVDSASLIPDDYTIRVTSFEPPIIESSADFTLQSRNETTYILTAERDVLSSNIRPAVNSTASLSLIIHHEAWIINYYPEPKTVTVMSSLTTGKNDTLNNHTVFGNRSLMQQSNIPNLFYPKKTQVLEKPRIVEKGNEIQYIWNNITIDPDSAVIIAYSHDYMDRAEVYNGDQIILPGVNISRVFGENNSSFIMNYSLKNYGPAPLHGMNMKVFFPEKVNNVQLLDLAEMVVNSSCRTNTIGKTTYNDGTGYFSTGKMLVSSCPGNIRSGEQQNYSITITGKKQNSGIIYPSFITYYLVDEDPYNVTGTMKRIWPGVDLVTENNVKSSRYYYYEVSVAIPETKFFIVNPDGNDAKNGTPVPHAATSAATSAPLPVTIAVTALGIVGVYAGLFRE
jgi:hypothetical protein